MRGLHCLRLAFLDHLYFRHISSRNIQVCKDECRQSVFLLVSSMIQPAWRLFVNHLFDGIQRHLGVCLVWIWFQSWKGCKITGAPKYIYIYVPLWPPPKWGPFLYLYPVLAVVLLVALEYHHHHGNHTTTHRFTMEGVPYYGGRGALKTVSYPRCSIISYE